MNLFDKSYCKINALGKDLRGMKFKSKNKHNRQRFLKIRKRLRSVKAERYKKASKVKSFRTTVDAVIVDLDLLT